MYEIDLPPIFSLKKVKAKRSEVLPPVLVAIQAFLVVALCCWVALLLGSTVLLGGTMMLQNIMQYMADTVQT
jgi:hypothetical protein